jgi:hypothetical protein
MGKGQKNGRDCAGTVAEVRGATGRVTLGCSLPRAIQTDCTQRDLDNLGDPPVHASPRTDDIWWGYYCTPLGLTYHLQHTVSDPRGEQ